MYNYRHPWISPSTSTDDQDPGFDRFLTATLNIYRICTTSNRVPLSSTLEDPVDPEHPRDMNNYFHYEMYHYRRHEYNYFHYDP